MKRLYYDLETTGVKYWKNGIHQLAGLIEIDGAVVTKFNIKLQPHPKAIIEPEALKVGGITEEILRTYQSMESGKEEFTLLLNKYVDRFDPKDKFQLVGFNNRAFDDKFLRMLFELCGDSYYGSWFYADSLDVSVLMAYALTDCRTELVNFKLGTVAAYMGIPFEEDKAHDALYDVERTYELFKIYEII